MSPRQVTPNPTLNIRDLFRNCLSPSWNHYVKCKDTVSFLSQYIPRTSIIDNVRFRNPDEFP